MNITVLFMIGFVIGIIIGVIVLQIMYKIESKRQNMIVQAKQFQEIIKQQMQNGCYKVVKLSELESWDDPE